MRARPNLKQIASSRAVLRASEREQSQTEVEILGRRFMVLPGVFSPHYFDSTRLFSRFFPYRSEDAFLEVGCGTGITSVFAVKNGAKHVLAVDINPRAMENAKLNAKLHNCQKAVEARQSDVFSAIRAGERFDTIYWNLPFILVDDDFQFKTIGERALFDPGYNTTRRFLHEAPKHLNKGGRIVLGFGDFGDRSLLYSICRKERLTIQKYASAKGAEGKEVEFILLIVTPKDDSAYGTERS
jgi:release factor glutamine methyltransferase